MRHILFIGIAAVGIMTAGCPPPASGPPMEARVFGGRPAPARATPPSSPAPGDIWSVGDIEMAWIPAGEFTMGSPASEPYHDPEDEKQRRLRLTRGFWMSRYEITQAQWRRVMGDWATPDFAFPGPNQPAELISWHDCQEFIQRMNSQYGKGFRLPREAEWEYACRAGTRSAFSFGNRITPDDANYNARHRYAGGSRGLYREATTPVGSFEANAWGLYDMHGNVWEWCLDRYGVSYSPSRFTTGPPKVIRGGSWMSEPMSCRSAYSYALDPGSRRNYVGMRLVWSD